MKESNALSDAPSRAEIDERPRQTIRDYFAPGPWARYLLSEEEWKAKWPDRTYPQTAPQDGS